MPTAIENLKPQLLWKHFAEISKIPRSSKNEQRVGEYIIGVAKRLGYLHEKDSVGNIVVHTPANRGNERAPTVVLQGHTDMVCEKNKEVQHDFTKDSITLSRSDGYIKAKGTTLGSDNGIGISAAIAVMEDNTLSHGPLELLFTVDEETGLTGAVNLKNDFLKGRILLNLDSEEEGSLYVGCAGGQDTIAKIPLEFEPVPPNSVALNVFLGGLKGGHSGLDINASRANAIKLITRVLWKLQRDLDARLVKLEGGSKRNAIPREAEAVLCVPKDKAEVFKRTLQTLQNIFTQEFFGIEANVHLTAGEVATPEKVISKPMQKRILYLLYALPHGVIKMSADIPGLVETSTNLATVSTKQNAIIIGTSQRSSIETEKENTVLQVRAVCLLAGATVETTDGYPGWKPNMASKTLSLAISTYKRLFGNEPEVKAVHAGLECGIIGEKYPRMDMISFGPTIEGAHSPEERVHIESVEKFWKFLTEMLKELAKP